MYLYDENGAPIGLQYRNKTYEKYDFDTYYFEKNLQGDIIAIYTENGTKIGSYTYDAWGNCTVSTESGATTIQKRIVRTLNPFRYRGYYYDTDTGLYYLQSRYYNPKWGRFLNADGQLNGGLLGYNMFAYCGNNPVMRADPDGESWILIGLITVCVCLLSGCSSNSEPAPEPEQPKPSVEPYSSYGGGIGNVYIVTEDKVAEIESNISDTDVIIVDYRTNDDPNMQIKQSYKIGKKKHQKEIAQIMIDYNSENPVDPAWNRSVNSLVDEWRFHNFAYSIGYKKERTADTDFNNNDEGKGFWDFVWR